MAYLAESGRAENGEVAEALRSFSRKSASMVLLRCFRRGFVSREAFKRGRVRRYIYELTDKGAKWLLYKASQMRDADQRGLKPRIEVGDKSTHLAKFQCLNQDQQGIKESTPVELWLLMQMIQTANTYAREYQLLKQQWTWLFLSL